MQRLFVILLYSVFFVYTNIAQIVQTNVGEVKELFEMKNKKDFSIIYKNIIIQDVSLDSLSIYADVEKSDNFIPLPLDKLYKDYNIDTNSFIIFIKTKKIIVLNGEIYTRKKTLKHIKSDDISKISPLNAFDCIKKYGWRKGRHGAILIETKRNTTPDK